MNRKDFTTTILVDQTPQKTFEAINDVRSWWSGEVDGDTDKLGAEFTYTVPGVHRSVQKIAELVPGKSVVWKVVDARLDFVKDKKEWIGTDIVFEIAKHGEQTEIRFSHKGLIPTFECYDACSNGWAVLVEKNLRNRILTGKAQPSPW